MVTSNETSLKDVIGRQAFRDSVGHLRHRVWTICSKCKEGRWVQENYRGNCFTRLCKKCRSRANLPPHVKGEDNPHWKGGRQKTQSGYIAIWVSPDNFFHPMANHHGYVREHRLVMAKRLNRCLLPWEVVHHKGVRYPLGSVENKQDNSIENLELLPGRKYHLVDTVTKSLIVNLQKRVTLLEAENIRLQKQSAPIKDNYRAIVSK